MMTSSFQPTTSSYISHPVRSEGTTLPHLALESFMDGVLILTTQQTCIHANQRAYQLCHLLTQNASNAVPHVIWQICQTLIDSYFDDSYAGFPNDLVMLESEIPIAHTTLRVRVRWLEESDRPHGYLLVILEDINQTKHNQAIVEAECYALTPRQKEVWLLRRAGYSYQQIANTLYITHNTVRKHLKESYAKRREALSR